MEEITLKKEVFNILKNHPHYYTNIYLYMQFNDIEKFNQDNFICMCKELKIEPEYAVSALKKMKDDNLFDSYVISDVKNFIIDKKENNLIDFNCAEAISLSEKARARFNNYCFSYSSFFHKKLKNDKIKKELLEYLIEYCSDNINHQTTYYMDKVINDWKEQGINTKDLAVKYVEQYQKKSNEKQKRALDRPIGYYSSMVNNELLR